MANTHHHIQDHETPGMDYVAHERTFNSFVTGVKWAIGIIVFLLVVLYFVVRP